MNAKNPQTLHPELHAFLETVSLGSVTKAARKLGISQPALSSRLSRLRRRVGQELLRKTGRSLKPTAHGVRLYESGMRVLRACEALDAAMRKGHYDGATLRVGTPDSVPKTIIRKILEPYVRAGIQVECREWRTDHLEQELEQHRLELLITDRQPLHLLDEDLACQIEGRTQFVLCASKELAASWKADNPHGRTALALPSRPSPLRERIDRWIARYAPKARVAVEADDRSLLNHFAHVGIAAVPLPVMAARAVCKQFDLQRLMPMKGVHESYYRVYSRSRMPSLLEG